MEPANALENDGAMLLAQSDGCSVWQFCNDTGEGTMTVYDVFPGVVLSFNDFHMEHYRSSFVPHGRMLAIDHCREGQMEYTAKRGMVGYITAGDVKLDRRHRHTGDFVFPSGHYHGLTAAFDLGTVGQSLSKEMPDFPVNPDEIISRFSLADYPRILHGMTEAEHIFGELYRVPAKIRIPYFRVKILELLLYLDAVTVPEDDDIRPYFYRTQAEKVKSIRQFLCEHISENYTQKALSQKFDIPMTAMKSCFRAIYGEAIGTWLACYRMSLAAEMLLREKETGIAEIGSRVGYDNAGKFTEAFKRMMKLTPSEYRRERGLKYEK
mgnify:CR=1 FL=1